jgi:hypothetical protein
MDTIIWLIAIVVVGLVAIAGLWYYAQRRKSDELRGRFGPEYDRVLIEGGSRRQAESELEARQKRVEKLANQPLPPQERERFRDAWKSAQARFVDEPSEAIAEADRLVVDVMRARGYPVGDFEQRAADISVNHPDMVENYRSARSIAEANQRGQANTEDMRQAMVRYRALFAELLEEPEMAQAEARR